MAPMAYGDGTIEERGTGRWRITWYAAGVRRRKTIRGTVTDARRTLRRALVEADRGKFIDHRKVTVSELLDDLLDDYRAKLQDVKTCEGRIRNLTPFFGKLLASRVGTNTVRAFVRKRKAAGVKDSTINRDIAALKRAFRLGYQHSPRKVVSVPYLPMAGPESPPREGFFTHEEFMRLRSNLPPEIAQLVTFLYHTGCRVGEARGIQWQSVSFEDARIRLLKTKNGRRRSIPVTRELLELLRGLRLERDQLWPESSFVFSRGGKRILSFRKSWENACRASGLPGRLVHDLRRTGARNLVRSGVAEHIVMAIGGWRTRSVFQRYDIVDDRDLGNAAAALDRYLDAKDSARTGLKSTEMVN